MQSFRSRTIFLPRAKLLSHFCSNLSQMAEESQIFDRAYGCLLGQAIGDALGTRYEFKSSKVTQSAIENDIRQRNGSYLPILGGGPFNMDPGQVTDDTEMAMSLARSMQRCKTFDVADVARSYATWYYSNPPDIGITTSRAFSGLPSNLSEIVSWSNDEIYRAIFEAAKQKNMSSLSNGGLMRISPLAVAGTHWPLDVLRLAAVADCNLTHPNPAVHDAVSAYVTAIWVLINTGDRAKAYEEASKRIQTSRIRQLLETCTCTKAVPVIIEDSSGPESVQMIDGDSTHMGYVGVAFKWAFTELRTDCETFENSLVRVISRGGDTDTNGCITGALLGAAVGASNIPEYWKAAVLSARPRRLKEHNWVDMSDAEALVKDLLSTSQPVSNFL